MGRGEAVHIKVSLRVSYHVTSSVFHLLHLFLLPLSSVRFILNTHNLKLTPCLIPTSVSFLAGEWCLASHHGDVSEQGDCLPEVGGLTSWAVGAMASGHSCYEYLDQVKAELDYQRALVHSTLEKFGVSLDTPEEGPDSARQEPLTSDFSDIPGTSGLGMSHRRHRRRGLKKKKRNKRRKSAEEMPVTVRPPHRPRFSLGNPSTSQEEEGETSYSGKETSRPMHGRRFLQPP